jgi:hypothetical protein
MDLLHYKRITFEADPDGWVPLKTAYLRNVFGRDAIEDVLGVLDGIGILECDRGYAIGKRSRRYRIAPHNRAWTTVEILAPKLRPRRGTIPLLPVHRHLRRHLDQLTIDFPSATRIVSELEPDEDSLLDCDEYRRVILDLCRTVQNRDFRLAPDMYGRVHSEFTRLPRSLRVCLRLDGQPITGIDLANAQPLLAGVMCVRYGVSRFTQYRTLNMSFDSSFCEQALAELERMCGCPSRLSTSSTTTYEDVSIVLEKRRTGTLLPPPWSLAPVRSTPLLSSCGAPPPDLLRYLDVCQRGELYESLGDDRATVKQAMMFIQFGRPGYRSATKSRFTELFPSVAAFLDDLKTKNGLPAADRYKYASHVLQNFEASMFIGRICRRLMQERPDLLVLTLHDCLYTTAQHVDDLLLIMREEFARIGISPTFKIEDPHAQPRPSRTADHCDVADGSRTPLRRDAGRVPDVGTSVR